ncbi:MAG: alanine/glycine:cation symporter family protein [Planctomycetota bacterium]|nr:alanine/glycine:cation symporter family protein [Planctomycetota bacterium]
MSRRVPLVAGLAVLFLAARSPTFAQEAATQEAATQEAATQEAAAQEPAAGQAGDAPPGGDSSGQGWLTSLKENVDLGAAVIDEAAGEVVEQMAKVLFWDPVKEFTPEEKHAELPDVKLVVIWLIFGSLAFTFLMGFINLRGFRHAIDLVRGRYSDPHSTGEVSHFQALSAALSATVGLGNIAGVAYAVYVGGPGAVFWMVASAFFGMSSKFVECTLGQKYRLIDAQGRVSGGAMHYLRRGMAELGWGKAGVVLGVVLSVVFSLLCIGGSLGGGNMFQANQSYEALSSAVGLSAEYKVLGSLVYGVALAISVGLVIIGGIRRIATTASRIVPLMCGLYVLGSLYIILTNYGAIPEALGEIFSQAFSTDAVKGGFIGVLVIGVQRAAFSNEAGIGSAAIAHAAAKTDEPVREGLVSLLEPFIDTIVVCSMTGLAVVITGAYSDPQFQEIGSGEAAAITVKAWSTVSDWFPLVLAAATVLFAFSTLISWSYYGERCWAYLFGSGSTLVYKVIFLLFILMGAVIKLGNVIDFSDMMILGMAFPNLLGCLLLSGKVRRDLKSYWSRYRAGEFQPRNPR